MAKKGKGFFGAVGSFLGSIPVVKKVKKAAKSVKKKIKKAKKKLKKALKNAKKKLKKKLGKVLTKARKLKNNLSKSKLVKRIKKAVKKAVKKAKKYVKKVVKTVKKAVKTAVKAVKKAVKKAAKTTVKAVKTAAKTTVKAVKTAAKTTVKVVKTAAKATVNTVKTAVETVKKTAKTVVKEVKKATKEAVKVYQSLEKMEPLKITKDMSAKEKWLREGYNASLKLAQKSKGTFDGTVDAVKGVYDDLIELVTNPIGVFKNTVEAVSHPIETAKTIGNSIKDSFERNVVNGNAYSQAYWGTKATINTATAVVGTKGLGSAAKIGKLPNGKNATKSAKVDTPKGTDKGGSSGNLRDFREAKDQDKKQIDDVFKKYNAGKRKNVAVTKGEINGEKIDLESVSGKIDPANPNHKDNFSKPSENYYKYSGSDKNGRLNDTEQKMIEHLREKYKDTPNVNGNIEIISHKAICQSCNDIIDQFQKDFPNINITRVQILDE
ncbi:deaminase domain-containing protein [Lysinibacillus sp. G4S2]|uniref:deaminase domain-containing protein n=1 Tax=Lysinibacillus sp. G4S2 TaxID=3055859 RepID=UPI0025A283D3|nr:deaminase domain-containing protein [Lysinibacillus sp. G4S2]MDM5249156.1 deaminase domain-containing protein [Lysinibacillus sp. G4S2]